MTNLNLEKCMLISELLSHAPPPPSLPFFLPFSCVLSGEFLCATALAILELTLQNSPICTCLPSVGIKGIHHLPSCIVWYLLNNLGNNWIFPTTTEHQRSQFLPWDPSKERVWGKNQSTWSRMFLTDGTLSSYTNHTRNFWDILAMEWNHNPSHLSVLCKLSPPC